MSLDDFFFYLPGYGSIALLLAGALGSWIVLRIFMSRRKERKNAKVVENPPKM